MTSHKLIKGLKLQRVGLEQELQDLKDAIAQLSDRKRALTIELDKAEKSETKLDLTVADAEEEENFVEFFSTEDAFLEETRRFLLDS